ncbi:ATP-binding protein [Chloroflexota bacterium]
MRDECKTKKQLIEELKSIRKRINELKNSINEHKQAGELLHIFRINTPIGMFVVQDRRFIFANKQFKKVIGIKPEKLVGSISLDHVYPDDREMVREKAIMMLKGELTTPYRYRIISKGGQLRWMMEGVVSIQYKGRRAVLGHSQDITDRIEAETKRQRLYENEKKLRHELEKEVQKRIEFTRALVHELKTPLTPILFSSELLVSELPQDPWFSIARNIHRGATNLNNRIDELLDLAKVEIGSLHLNLDSVDTRKLLINTADSIGALITKNNQYLVRDIPASLPKVWADKERLQQIILNLLINASKFTPGEGTITFVARKKNNTFMVKVKDTGPGIPKTEQARIFEPYQRRRSDRGRLSGLGLGLSLCKYLVKLHGGEICLESSGVKGSIFTFFIPIKSSIQIEENGLKEQTGEAAINRR